MCFCMSAAMVAKFDDDVEDSERFVCKISIK